MTETLRRAAVGLGALVVLAGVAYGGGQTTGPQTPTLVIDSMYGPDLYRMYCATCHGRDGKGGGPAAAALKVPPPDLTLLARRHSGVFPVEDVRAIVRGTDAVPAHGSADMPMWGPIFKALDPSDARTDARIRTLVDHVASLQR